MLPSHSITVSAASSTPAAKPGRDNIADAFLDINVGIVFPRRRKAVRLGVIHGNNPAAHFREGGAVADDGLRLNAPQHFLIALQKEILLPLHPQGGDGDDGAFFNAVKTVPVALRQAPGDGGDDREPFGLQIRPTPAGTEGVVQLLRYRHRVIGAELGGEHAPILAELFNARFGIVPQGLKFVVVQKKVDKAVGLRFVVKLYMVVANHLDVLQVNGLPPYDGQFKHAVRLELVSQEQGVASEGFTRQYIPPFQG